MSMEWESTASSSGIIVHNFLTTVHILYGVGLSVICILVLAASFTLYNTDYALVFTSGEPLMNEDVQRAIDVNIVEAKKGFTPIPCEPDNVTEAWTGFTEQPYMRCQTTGNGFLNILLLGNSIAYKAFPLFKEILNGRYGTLRLYSKGACPPLSEECPDFTEASRIVVEKTKPDIIFNMWATQDWKVSDFSKPVTNWETDEVYQQFQKNLDFYSNHSRHIVLDTPYYNTNTRVSYQIVKRLRQGLPLDDLKVTREESDIQQHWHQERVLRLKCKNCEVNKLDEALFDLEGIFYLYDRKTMFATLNDGLHLTETGLELLRAKYSEIVDRLISKLSN